MNFSSLDLNLLRVLDALLETRSATLAGRRIGLSQPAVSAALGRLRHVLGDPLFIRQGRQLVPTEYATSIAAPLRDLLDGAQTLLSAPAAFDPARARRVFRLTGSDFYSEFLIPALMTQLQDQAPGLRVQMLSITPGSAPENLDWPGLDLAILPRAPIPDWLESAYVFSSDFVVIAADDNTRTGGGPLSLDLYCEMGHVLCSPEGRMHGIGDTALAQMGKSRRVMLSVPSFAAVHTTVSQSDLLALVPRQMAEAFAPRLGLRVLPPPMPVDPVEICMVWHRRASTSPAHRWLRGVIAGILAPLDVRNG